MDQEQYYLREKVGVRLLRSLLEMQAELLGKSIPVTATRAAQEEPVPKFVFKKPDIPYVERGHQSVFKPQEAVPSAESRMSA